ncbi:MAG: hypothetical protein IAI50_18080, partial [Candidatus Eremiobacteraeota bacterium]|nr:hypothetical protein [Candidatus Eremiobacteraeota bacterium]
MSVPAVSQDIGCRLAAYVAANRQELIATIVRAPGISRLEADVCGAFAGGLID